MLPAHATAITLCATVFLLLSFTAEAFAPAAGDGAPSRVFSPSDDEKHALAPYLEYLDDPNGELSIQDVLAGRGGAFAPLPKAKEFGYNYAAKALWLRFSVDTSRYPREYWFLSYDYQHIGNLQVYFPAANGVQRIELDEKLPLEGRRFDVREYLVEVPSVSTPTHYYIRLEPHTRYLKVEFSWSGLTGALEAVHDYQLMYGLFFGGLLVMWAYNVALYATLRDKSYLYYVWYLGCFSATFFHIYGLSVLFIRLNPFFEQIFAAAAYGAIHGMVLFTRHFLTLRSHCPWMDRYLHVFQWILCIGGGLAFLQPVGRPFVHLNYLILLVLPVMVAAGLKRWYQGYAPARVFSFGWAIFGAGLGLLSLRSVGILPANIITDHAVMVSSVAEALIFSVALAYRINAIEKEKKDALDEERALLEQRVAERTKTLQQSLESRRMILANAAHELRSPVNAVRLLVDAVSLKATQDFHQVVANVQAITAHMAQLVDNLLLLDVDQPVSRGGGPMQNFDIGDEITATAKIVGPLRQGSRAGFNVDADGCKGVMARGDLTSFRRVLVNLLSNAFKFTEQGEVALRVEHSYEEASRKIVVVVRVSDTGQGIPSSMRDEIFLPFITTTARSGASGTGLGLAISRKLAMVMGGTLELVRSAEGRGSEFACTVRFEPALEQPDAVPPAGDTKPAKRLSIILAEDDPITADAVQLIIRQLGHAVACVATAQDLLRELASRSKQFDVALIDNRLPGGYGIDVIKRCGEMSLAVRTRKVLMTADATLETMEAAASLGCEVVTKPTSAAYLRSLLGVAPTRLNERASVVLDPGPLTMLKRAGASVHELRRLCEQFRHAIDAAVDQLTALAPMKGASSDAVAQARQIVHRVLSSCSTIGAIALADDFKEFQSNAGYEQGDAQLVKLVERCAATHRAVECLLGELAIT